MRTMLVLLLLAGTAFAADLPDRILTPGAVELRSAELVCVSGQAGARRKVSAALKRQVYQRYGMSGNDRSGCSEGFEIDHLVPLVIGGSNDVENLWPQSFCSDYNAHHKDRLELRLHKLVCDGELSLKKAQACIKEDWIKCYKRTFKEED